MKVVVILSKAFPPKHPKAGWETDFSLRVKCGQALSDGARDCGFPYCGLCRLYNERGKIHTCRIDYDYWKKRINRLKEVGGVLSVRQWSGVPFRSRQETIVDIPAEYVGIQRAVFTEEMEGAHIADDIVFVEELADNDGLSSEDFLAWFKDHDPSRPLAVIHFTKFRY
ncbi:MAG: hypothetical protein LBG96_16660 [Tannerella sp.]|nr:hypothetical protein [Tannerella sp.]